MNEPFVGGTNASIQMSTEQLLYKRKRDYEPQVDETLVVKDENEIKKEMQKEWIRIGEGERSEIEVLLVKENCKEMFGLNITYRASFLL